MTIARSSRLSHHLLLSAALTASVVSLASHVQAEPDSAVPPEIPNAELAAPATVTNGEASPAAAGPSAPGQSGPHPTASPAAAPADQGDAAEADGEAKRLGIYLQLGGGATGFGIGVAYRVVDEFVLDAGVGGMLLGEFGSVVSPFVEGSWLSGVNHHLELGAGAAALIVDADSDPVRPVVGPHIGYRYQKLTSGFLFRATLHGFYMVERDVFGPWLGLSFGGTLN